MGKSKKNRFNSIHRSRQRRVVLTFLKAQKGFDQYDYHHASSIPNTKLLEAYNNFAPLTQELAEAEELAEAAAMLWEQGWTGQKPKKPRARKRNQSPANFYYSRQWRHLRYQVLRALDGACALCGRTVADGIKLHVDHIKPRSKYPELELDYDNLQVLCEDCNLGKSNRDEIDWR